MPAESEKQSVKLSLPLVSMNSLAKLGGGVLNIVAARNTNKTFSMSSARTMN